MGTIIAALLGSFWVRAVGAVLLGLVALKGYGLAKEMQGAARGRGEVREAVTQKAAEDVKAASEVATEAAAGKGTKKSPYTRSE